MSKRLKVLLGVLAASVLLLGGFVLWYGPKSYLEDNMPAPQLPEPPPNAATPPAMPMGTTKPAAGATTQPAATTEPAAAPPAAAPATAP
jgi:hypothetical protein